MKFEEAREEAAYNWGAIYQDELGEAPKIAESVAFDNGFKQGWQAALKEADKELGPWLEYRKGCPGRGKWLTILKALALKADTAGTFRR